MKKRVFIAINLPKSTKEEIGKIISQCKKINPNPAIRYVKHKAMHLTLHFLGDLEEKEIDQVKIILKNEAKLHQQTELITDEIGAFPNLNKPRVIFLSGKEKEGDSLISLQKNLGEKLKTYGIGVDPRIWHAHLTLARIVMPLKFKTENLKLPNLKIPIRSIELLESHLSPYGAEHKIIGSYALKA
jgi:2'-5' RNA ligase